MAGHHSETNCFGIPDYNDLIEDEYDMLTDSDSPYYDSSQFVHEFKQVNNFTIITLNLDSLKAKYNNLLTWLELLNRESSKPMIIAVQETRVNNNDNIDIFHIPGYNFISKGKPFSLKTPMNFMNIL